MFCLVKAKICNFPTFYFNMLKNKWPGVSFINVDMNKTQPETGVCHFPRKGSLTNKTDGTVRMVRSDWCKCWPIGTLVLEPEETGDTDGKVENWSYTKHFTSLISNFNRHYHMHWKQWCYLCSCWRVKTAHNELSN